MLYRTNNAHNGIHQSIEKVNKRLKGLGGDSRAGLQRLNFERVRTYWAARTGTWLAVDFEEWERESTLLLEFGWSLVRWDQAGTEVNELGHVVIKERMGYTNSQYVAGRRDVSVAANYILTSSYLAIPALQFRSKRACQPLYIQKSHQHAY